MIKEQIINSPFCNNNNFLKGKERGPIPRPDKKFHL